MSDLDARDRHDDLAAELLAYVAVVLVVLVAGLATAQWVWG